MIEAVVKVIGLSARGYFSDRWNIFDFVIVVGSLVDIVLEFTGQGGSLTFLGLFRSLRIIKLLKSNKNTEKLLATFFRSFAELYRTSLCLCSCSLWATHASE